MNDSQLKSLWAELQKPEYGADVAAKNWQAIADALNARESVPNPAPQGQVDKRISVDDFVKTLKPSEVVTVFQNSALANAYTQSLQANDRKLTKSLWRGLKTLVSPETVAAIEAMQDAKEADPTWQPTIAQPSSAMGLGLPVVTAGDVQTALFRNAGAAQ